MEQIEFVFFRFLQVVGRVKRVLVELEFKHEHILDYIIWLIVLYAGYTFEVWCKEKVDQYRAKREAQRLLDEKEEEEYRLQHEEALRVIKETDESLLERKRQVEIDYVMQLDDRKRVRYMIYHLIKD